MDRSTLLILRTLLVLDLAAGIAWWWGAPARSMTPAYEPVRLLLDPLPGDPARIWGSILVYLSMLGLVAFALPAARRMWPRLLALAGLAGYWLVWVGVFGIAALTRGDAGIVPVILAAFPVLLHAAPVVAVRLDDER